MTMTNLIDRTADLLYPDEGPTTVDIKISHGSRGGRDAQSICKVIHQGMSLVQSGQTVPVTDFSGF